MFFRYFAKTQQRVRRGDCACKERTSKVYRQNSDGRKRDWEEEHYDKPFKQASRAHKVAKRPRLGPFAHDFYKWDSNAEHSARVYKELGEAQIFVTAWNILPSFYFYLPLILCHLTVK